MPGSAITSDSWVHLCAVWNGEESFAALYMNGYLAAETSTAVSTMPVTDQPIRIGTDGHFFDWFKGTFDELRIWNYARSEKEIRQQMNRQISRNKPGLIGYWRFNEGDGNMVSDLSPTGNDAGLGSLNWHGGKPDWVLAGK